jgi:2-polyprenyl-3-methyl-5-hydroxy-6-metoxy-1,4-benzoquinol methylase
MNRNIQVGKTFNVFASEYIKVSNKYTVSRRYQKAAKYSKGCLLDLGGASGLFSASLGEEIKPVVLDISINMCKEAQLNNITKIVCADAENLPFNEKSFDSIVSLEMIYYLENPLQFIFEAERILKSDGTLVVSFYNSKLNFLVIIRSFMRKLKFRSMFIDDGNPNFTKLEDFYNLIDKTEFEIIEIENIVFIPFKIFNKLNLFLETTFLKKFALFNIVYLKKNS